MTTYLPHLSDKPSFGLTVACSQLRTDRHTRTPDRNACTGGLSAQTGLERGATAWHVGYNHLAKPYDGGGA
eukprot:COSAG05_NODE_10193_length_578_cov_1.156576_1_plen_70_part_10